jgi:trk system potassium uptake protein TrkA
MKIIIGGFGRVGKYLAYKLDNEGHSVTVIDKEPSAFNELNPSFKGKTHTGIVFDRNILESAGIRDADAYIAVTNGDNSNIVSARIAREYYRVPKVLARIYDPRRAEIYRDLGIPTVATVVWASSRFIDLVVHPEVHTEYEFGNSEVILIEATVPVTFENKKVMEIEVTGEIRISSIVRDQKAFIPAPTTVLKRYDRLFIAVSQDSLGKLERLLGIE